MRLPLSFSALLLAALPLAAALPSVAQTHYCMGGDLDHMTQAEINTCHAKMTEVREAVRRRGAPSGWRFLVVCDEGSWHDVAALTGRPTGSLRTVDFQTDPAAQVTFIRGSHVATEDGTAARLLNAALEGVPGRYTAPGIGVTPAPIPNVQPKREVPTLLMADARESSLGAQEELSGQ